MFSTILFMVSVVAGGNRQAIDVSQFGPAGGYQPLVTVVQRIENEWQAPQEITLFDGMLPRRRGDSWLVTWNQGVIGVSRNGQILDIVMDQSDPYRTTWTWFDGEEEKRGFLLGGPKNTLVLQLGNNRLFLKHRKNGSIVGNAPTHCDCQDKTFICIDSECDVAKKCGKATDDNFCKWYPTRHHTLSP